MPGFFETNFPKNYALAQKRYNKFISIFNSTTSTNNNTETTDMFGRNTKQVIGKMFAKSSLNKNAPATTTTNEADFNKLLLSTITNNNNQATLKTRAESEVTEFDEDEEQESLRILENNEKAKQVQQIVDEAFGIIEVQENARKAETVQNIVNEAFAIIDAQEKARITRFMRFKAALATFANSVVSIITSPFRAVWWALSTGASKVASLFTRSAPKAEHTHTAQSIIDEANIVLKAKEAAEVAISEKQNTKGCMSRFTGWGWKAKQDEVAFKQYLTKDGDLDINAVPNAEVEAALQAHKNRPIVI